MTIFQIIEQKFGNNLNTRIFKVLGWVLGIAGFLLILGILFPTAMAIFWNIVWVFLLFLVILFFGLGFLTLLGLKKEVSQILDVLLEGGLSFIDFIQFLKEVWQKFVEILMEFILYAAWIFAYIICAIIYLLILTLYKTVGTQYDVTIMTIVLTVGMVTVFGIISRPKLNIESTTAWLAQFKKRFRQGFIDGLELILFAFFLTIDSTNIFFLPANLNVELHAKLGHYDLMTKSIDYHVDLKFTLTLLILATTFEVIRNILRIIATSRAYYAQDALAYPDLPFLKVFKISLRSSFNDLKDDLIKFMAFTSLLSCVFLFFPKLKLLTLALASGTSLLLDLFMRERLTIPKGEDLISRIITKVFKL